MKESTSPLDRVLVVDDEPSLRKVLGAMLRRAGYTVTTAADGRDAVDKLAREEVSVVVTDMKMPNMDGLELLRHVVETAPDVPVIIVTAFGTVDGAVEAIKLGAFDYVTKPFDRAEIQQVIAKAARMHRVNKTAVRPGGLTSGGDRFGMVGSGEGVRAIYQLIDRVADTPATALITGESGTGKELVARALHEHSSRRKAPFIRVNCAAIPRELVESELFGHEKGAFTGAVSSKPGRFELADGGTLFLDEVGEIPLETQVKLLRAIQESTFERVGGVRTLTTDVRLIAATNRALPEMIDQGKFREDLYYRLNVVPMHLPPLRDRAEDIPDLMRHAAVRAAQRLGRPVPVFDEDALTALQAYAWPGNIRELENLVERTVLLTDAKVISVEDLPEEVLAGVRSAPKRTAAPIDDVVADVGAPEGVVDLKQAVREGRERIERELIARALERTEHNVTQASKLLGISRKSLQLKMKELGLRDEPDPVA